MEIWDILDENRKLTGKTINRGEQLKDGEFHLVVHIWIINSNGEILIQKRPEHLEFAPGLWATTGGSATQGEDSISAAFRETKEELGIEIDKDSMLGPLSYKRKDDFTDIWLVNQDIDLEDIILQKEEVSDAKWVSTKELNQMICEGCFHRYSDEYFGLLAQLFKQ